jgi:hypothetical protein
MLQRLFGRATSRGLLHDSTVPITIVPSSTAIADPDTFDPAAPIR